MRLIEVSTLKLEEFPYEGDVPPYAILSHRWGRPEDEVSYSDLCTGQKLDTPGYAKILAMCREARQHDYKFCWIDTCCINKDSSAELSESINSMYRWYEGAGVCFAYLADVRDEDFSHSEWFRRGWTLQELLAPKNLHMFNSKWQPLGTKDSCSSAIEKVTRIPMGVLTDAAKLNDCSIAQKMSWASGRTTSRKEDEAYCLLGLFNINMPLLYGEGQKAFRRLQELILSTSFDHTLLAWGISASGVDEYRMTSSLLALSPADFTHSGKAQSGGFSYPVLFEATSQGILISIHRSYDARLQRLTAQKPQISSTAMAALSVPLDCYSMGGEGFTTLWLHLRYVCGLWWRFGIQARPMFDFPLYQKTTTPLHSSDYIRLYVFHSSGSIHLDHDDGEPPEHLPEPLYVGLPQIGNQKRSVTARLGGILK